MVTLNAAYQKDLLDKQTEYLTLASLLLQNNNPYWAAKVLEAGRKKRVPVIDEKTKEEKIVPVVKDTEKNLKLLADSWRMAQEVDKAIPILEKSAKMSKDGESYVILGNLYLSEDRVDEAVDAIKKGLEKGKVKKLSQVYLTLGQAYFELEKFEEAKKNFRIAARDKDKKIKQAVNRYILSVSENGYGKRSSYLDYRVTNRGGKGIIGIINSPRNGNIASSIVVNDSDEILLSTDKGSIMRCAVKEIRTAGRNTQGVRIIKLSGDEKVVSAIKIDDNLV